jgi:hypothetical protein
MLSIGFQKTPTPMLINNFGGWVQVAANMHGPGTLACTHRDWAARGYLVHNGSLF